MNPYRSVLLPFRLRKPETSINTLSGHPRPFQPCGVCGNISSLIRTERMSGWPDHVEIYVRTYLRIPEFHRRGMCRLLLEATPETGCEDFA